MEEALRLIISRSANATDEAMQCLAAIRAKSPVLQLRYNRTVMLALNDPAAQFTTDERALLAEHVGSGGETDTRTVTVSVRMTAEERERLTVLADGGSLSDYIRRVLFAA